MALKRTPIKRGGPLKRTGFKKKRKKPMRHKAKPTSRRAKLEAETEKWVKKAYQGVRCIICAFENTISTYRTCGHHIVPKSRCRPGRHDPANLVPLGPSHHTMGNDCCPHSTNPLASAKFDRWLEKYMPKRFAATRELNKRAKQGPKYTIDEVEQDHAFWEAVEQNGRDYEFICEAAGVEAYAEGDSDAD